MYLGKKRTMRILGICNEKKKKKKEKNTGIQTYTFYCLWVYYIQYSTSKHAWITDAWHVSPYFAILLNWEASNYETSCVYFTHLFTGIVKNVVFYWIRNTRFFLTKRSCRIMRSRCCPLTFSVRSISLSSIEGCCLKVCANIRHTNTMCRIYKSILSNEGQCHTWRSRSNGNISCLLFNCNTV